MITSTGLPRLPREFVPSARLYALLDECPPLTVVRAPAGFGKTALIASWLRDRRPADTAAIWLTLRSQDGAGDAFWRRVLRTLTEAGLAARSSRTVPPLEQLDRLLARTDESLILVLDSYDLVTDPAIDDDVIDLVRRHDALHVVICLRDGLRLDPASWYEVDGLMVTATDLMLDTDQTTELFERLGVKDPAQMALDLAPQLGGWATAVRAVALGLRDDTEDGADAAAEAAVQRVRDRLGTVLLRQFDQATADEVVFPSVLLGTFTRDELTRVVPSQTSPIAVDSVLRSGLVLVDNGLAEPRYQWPGFAQGALIAELSRRKPEREKVLRAQVAASLHALGRTPEAFAHAVQAGDWDLGASMLDRDWAVLFSENRQALNAAVSRAPESAVRGTMSLLALRQLFNPDATANSALVRATLPADADALRRLAGGEHVETVLSTAQLVLVTLRGNGMFLDACHQAERLMLMLRAVPAERRSTIVSRIGGWALQCGLTFLHAGRLNDAVAALELAFERGVDAPVPYVSRNAAAALAVSTSLQGSYLLAAEWLQRAEQAPDPDSWAKPFIDTTLECARALIAVAGLQREAGLAAAERLISPPPRQVLRSVLLHAQARVALHWGDQVGFAALLREERERPSPSSAPRRSAFGRRLLLVDEVDLTMALGAGSRAQALLDSGDRSSPFEVRRGWLALRGGRAREASSSAAAALADGRGSAEDDVSALLLTASAARVAGERESACRSAGLALRRIAASGCVATLAVLTSDERAALQQEVPESADLIAVVGEKAGQYPNEIAVIHLSERERAVLEHLAAGRSQSEIAQADFVTLNTLKTQTRSLYRKLGASDRDSALARAYGAGLL